METNRSWTVCVNQGRKSAGPSRSGALSEPVGIVADVRLPQSDGRGGTVAAGKRTVQTVGEGEKITLRLSRPMSQEMPKSS